MSLTIPKPSPCALFSAQALQPLPLHDFAALCLQRLQQGERLLSLFGRAATLADTGDWVLTAVFLPPEGALCVVRGQARRGEHYPSLSASHPAAQIHERELWEQTGVVPEGHPWLKPVRFEGERQQHMADYPFFTVRGNEVHEVGVGPIHASVIEPGHFRFMCHGERVIHLEIQLGYQHRGAQALLLRRPAWSLTPIIESIAGDSAVAYAWAHCQAMEALSGRPVSADTALSRAVGLEMERIAMHVATLNGLATDIAYLQAAATYGRLRTAIINASQRVCGNRFGRGWLRPGWARSLSAELRDDLRKTLQDFARDIHEVNGLMRSARSVKARFVGTGVLSPQAALDMGLTGVVARASGVALDLRERLPGAYEHAPIATVTSPAGDCWARMDLRMQEIDASVAWLLEALARAPGEQAAARAPAAPEGENAALAARTLCVSLVEGTRGPVLQAIETSDSGGVLHHQVQDPSLANWFGLALAVRDNGISDFPICNKSFDLSYCGNDL